MKTKLWIALISLYIVWGSTYLAMRYVVETIPPFMYAGIRFLIAGAILFIWRRAAGDEKPTLNNWKATTIAGTLLLLGGNAMIALAEKHVPSSIAALMVGTSPFWMTLFEALRTNGTKPTWQTVVGLLIGFIGMFLLIGPGKFTGSSQHFEPLSLIAMCIAPILWALGSIYARGADMPKSGLMSTGMEMLASAVPLFIVSVATGELNGFSLGQVSMRSWLGMAYLITFGSLVGFVSYGWLLHNAPLSLTSTFAYVNPVVAVFLGWLLAGEVLNARIMIASAIIVGSVIFINLARQNATRKAPVKPDTATEKRLAVGSR
jgi:drug/metabolite transporter (DMT)-like permease